MLLREGREDARELRAAPQVAAAAIEDMGNARVIATLFDGLSRALAPEVEPGGTY